MRDICDAVLILNAQRLELARGSLLVLISLTANQTLVRTPGGALAVSGQLVDTNERIYSKAEAFKPQTVGVSPAGSSPFCMYSE